MIRRKQNGKPNNKHPRCGYLYVSVMGVALICSVVGFSAMTLARMKLANAQDGNDFHEAALLAVSAVEYGMANINDNAAWRSGYTNNVESPGTPILLGNGTITIKFIDADGNLSNNSSDKATLYGIGRVGDAVQVQSVEITPNGNGMDIVPGTWVRATAP